MDGFYTVNEVCGKLQVARETLRRWERDEWFPKRIRFSRHARGRVAFLKSEVDGWIAARSASREVRPA
jgi:predicted DNA-binding transcriptional regulator AlpA